MAEYVAKRDKARCPTHPGAVLRDSVLPRLQLPKTEIAALLGISRQHLNDILLERKPVSANAAVRLGKLLGNGGLFWVRMQAAHDTWHAEQTIDVTGIPTLDGRAA